MVLPSIERGFDDRLFLDAAVLFGYRPRGDFLGADEVGKLSFEYFDIVSNPGERLFEGGLRPGGRQSCCRQQECCEFHVRPSYAGSAFTR